MNPFTVILGITLGSLVSMAFSLGGVLLIFWIIRDQSNQLDAEMPELIRSAAIFFSLAVLAAAGFFGTVKKKSWRHACLALLWLGLIGTSFYYWPD